MRQSRIETAFAVLAGLALMLMGFAAPANASGFDRRLFDLWVSARAGDGAPVYWYSTGTMRAYPSGELLATMEGFDTARSFRPERNQPLVHQYSRKIYIFRDTVSGEVIRERGGVKAEPIAYPYQFITYELKGDIVATMVEQGSGARVQRIGPGSSMTARWLGNTAAFSAPLFLDFPIPAGGRYTAWENYDFFVQTARGVREPHQLSWVRYGPAPTWAGGVPTIMHLTTWRIERYEDLPATMRTYIDVDAPLWKAPPRDLADIRRLQAGE
jgi:hypothetical protein